MSISLIQKYLWMLVFAWTLTSTIVFAQSEQGATQAEALPPVPPKIVSPELNHTNPPKSVYQLDEIIPYQVSVKWPEPPVDARMNSPEMLLDNLELVGVGQETVSNSDEDLGEEQLLTLRFKALKPGPAKVSSLVLIWAQAGGISTSTLKIPPVQLTIQKKSNLIPWFGGGIVIATLSAAVILLIRRKKRHSAQAVTPKTLEERIVVQFDHVKNSGVRGRDFLNELSRVLERYLQEKFDWNRSQEDYNALQKKAEKNWDKKEVREIKDFFEKIDFYRFSGSGLSEEELINLFQSARSFVERKVIV